MLNTSVLPHFPLKFLQYANITAQAYALSTLVTVWNHGVKCHGVKYRGVEYVSR